MARMHQVAMAAVIGTLAWAAEAAPPRIEGTLRPGTAVASVAADSGPWSTPERWSFWTFRLSFDQMARIDVRPLSTEHDVFIAVWYGVESDTAAYYDMNSGSANTVFVASADAAGPGLPDGPGQVAGLSLRNLFGSGVFALAVADYADGRGLGLLPYEVSLAVPEPSALVLGVMGLGALALQVRRRS